MSAEGESTDFSLLHSTPSKVDHENQIKEEVTTANTDKNKKDLEPLIDNENIALETPNDSSQYNCIKSTSNEDKTKAILRAWADLQKIIKEEITLEEIITKQLDENHNTLITSYSDYYRSKIKTREIFENITLNSLNNNSKKNFYELEDEPQVVLKDAFEPIKNLLFLMRKNYDYTMKIISLLEEDELIADSANINSIVELLCHQFYDNILIPNPEQEELLTLCFLIIKREIDKMSVASVFSFCDENTTFAGKFLKSFAKRPELKSYLSVTLRSLIKSIENSPKSMFDLNPKIIQEFIKKTQKNEQEVIRDDETPTGEDLLDNIPKCSINIEESPSRKNTSTTFSNTNHEFNENYKIPLNQKNINNFIATTKDKNLKEFFQKQFEKMNKDPEVFTNKKFQRSLDDLDPKQSILNIYKENFLFIKKKIEDTLQMLIKKITTLPYTLRCVCKMIHILITKKFPKLNAYEVNSFLGEFIFGKWIIPMLLNNSNSAMLFPYYISSKTKMCLRIISKILTQINRGSLFESNINADFTIFNHFIIEVLPSIHEFYNLLIDVDFPTNLNNFIEKTKAEPTLSAYRIATLNKEKNKTEVFDYKINYNYFENNPDENEHIQCICFCLNDIFLLNKVILEHINEFSTFPQFIFFKKTVDKIKNEDYKLDQEIKKCTTRLQFKLVSRTQNEHSAKDSNNSTNQKLIDKYNFTEFFLVYKEEKNKDIHKKELSRDFQLADGGGISVSKKIKFCIKTILKGLNVISSKDYSYLNAATSTKNFFIALKNTLEDLEANIESEGTKNIPLKWYCQYMINNESLLDEEYIKNDYMKLYQELLQEETDSLNFLKSYIGTIFTSNGMNIRCSEKINEKAKRDYFRMKLIDRFSKIVNFVNSADTSVCLKIKEAEPNFDSRSTQQPGKFDKIKKILSRDSCASKTITPSEERNIVFEISDAKTCYHELIKRTEVGAMNEFKKKKFHPETIQEVIKELTKEKIISCIKSDVSTGKQKYKIFSFMEKWMKIVKERMNHSFFEEENEVDKNMILEKIEDYIMKKLYSHVFPKEPSENDKNFTKKTEELKWITVEDLDIKKISVNELEDAIECINKMDEGTSVYEKLEMIASAYNTINNTLKFSSGKDDDGGAEDLSPIFQYIIIQAQPKFFFSNINYIKTFLSPSKYKGLYGFLLSQIEFSAEFINNITRESLRGVS